MYIFDVMKALYMQENSRLQCRNLCILLEQLVVLLMNTPSSLMINTCVTREVHVQRGSHQCIWVLCALATTILTTLATNSSDSFDDSHDSDNFDNSDDSDSSDSFDDSDDSENSDKANNVQRSLR